MPDQPAFPGLRHAMKTKQTRREKLLAEMEEVVPWRRLLALIEPFYPKRGARGGRPPMPLEMMLRVYFLQQWYALSDPMAEEMLYHSKASRSESSPSSSASAEAETERVSDRSHRRPRRRASTSEPTRPNASDRLGADSAPLPRQAVRPTRRRGRSVRTRDASGSKRTCPCRRSPSHGSGVVGLYNTERPHSALGYRSSMEFLKIAAAAAFETVAVSVLPLNTQTQPENSGSSRP